MNVLGTRYGGRSHGSGYRWGLLFTGDESASPVFISGDALESAGACQRTELAILQHDLTYVRLDELTDIDEWADYEWYL
ncbi:hypothetical protein GCM10028808_63270 [Spirosoma migulaei]